MIRAAVSVTKTLNFDRFQESLGFYLAAIAFPGDLRKMIKSTSEDMPKYKKEFIKGLHILNKIEDAFIRYSKNILKEFIRIPEACLLLRNFLETIEEKELSETHTQLKDMSSKTLKTLSKDSNWNHQNSAVKIFNLINE